MSEQYTTTYHHFTKFCVLFNHTINKQ